MPVVVASATGRVDTARYRYFLNDQAGPVRRELRRRGLKMHASLIRRTPRRTGKLVSTARQESGLTGEKPWVQSTLGRAGETDYLGYLINGTPAHLIYPRQNRPNPHLRFVVGGVIVYAKLVHHPGTRANNFMHDALMDARG